MKTEDFSSLLLSLLLVTSLMVPLSIVALVSVSQASGDPELADHIVISEVFYDESGADYNEFVELYNPTTREIDIGGWQLKHYNQAGTLQWTLTFDNGTTIPSHGYYLIGQKDPENSPDWDNFPISPDAILPGSLQNGAGDYIVLDDNKENSYVDGVKWGYYGAGTPIIEDDPNYDDVSSGNSIERKSGPVHDEDNGNGYDTDDASNDFRTRTTPQPQNSDNLREPCGVDVWIDPYHLRGVPCDTLTFIVWVHNAGVENDNFILWVENDGWPMGIDNIWLDENRFVNVPPCESVSTVLHVHIPNNENLAWPCMHKEIVVVVESETCHARDNDNAMVQVISRFLHNVWPGYEPLWPDNWETTWWHELYPDYCTYYELTSWHDTNGDNVTSPCDIIDITRENDGMVFWHHVKDVTLTMCVWDWGENYMCLEFLEGWENYWKYWDPDPWIQGTQWHAVWPPKMFSNLYWLFWEDTNLSGYIDFCDTVWLTDKTTGIEIPWHVENVVTDLVLCEKCGVEVTIEPEYQSGEPGENLYYDVTVKNTGTEVCSFDLSYIDSVWPDISIEPSRLENIPEFENKVATLIVHVPEDAEPCTEKEIIVIAESDCCDAVDNDNCTAHVLYPAEYYIKENMPDLGQHCINWCWCAAAANSIKWYAEYRDYPEYIGLLDDPDNAVFPDNNYLELLYCPWEGAKTIPRLLHEIALDVLYPGVPDNQWPDNDVDVENDTWCHFVTDNQFYHGLREFIKEQGFENKLYVHEIIDDTHFAPENIPSENDNVIIYRPPTFEDYKRELGRCQDVLLQLDFRNAGYESYPYGREALDHIVTGVSFYDGGPGNQWIEVADPWTPFPPGPSGPDHNYAQTRYTYENLRVVNEDPLTVTYTGENMGVPLVDNVQVVKLIYISPAIVEENRGVVVDIDPKYQSGTPDNDIYYTVWVTNTGTVSDTYDLENSDTNGWTLSLSQSSVGPIAPGDNDNVTLTVTLDNQAPFCTRVTVTATSQTDNTVSDSDSCIAHALPENALTVSLVTGWNLVGFTGISENDNLSNIFCGLTYYDNYYLYYWNPPGGPYGVDLGPDDFPEDNIGYWVWIDQDTTVGTTGTPPENRDIHLVTGWNLVSFPIVNENTTIGNVFTGLTYYDNYYLYYWNPPGGPYGVDLDDTSLLEDNLGYWVWIDQNKTVTVP